MFFENVYYKKNCYKNLERRAWWKLLRVLKKRVLSFTTSLWEARGTGSPPFGGLSGDITPENQESGWRAKGSKWRERERVNNKVRSDKAKIWC